MNGYQQKNGHNSRPHTPDAPRFWRTQPQESALNQEQDRLSLRPGRPPGQAPVFDMSRESAGGRLHKKPVPCGRKNPPQQEKCSGETTPASQLQLRVQTAVLCLTLPARRRTVAPDARVSRPVDLECAFGLLGKLHSSHVGEIPCAS